MADISTRSGRYVLQPTGYRAFIPNALPPDPELEIDGELQCHLNDAALELGRLDGLTVNLPNPDMFLSMYVRKEALLSSQIEGTQASLDDVLAYEVGPTAASSADVGEVVNYVRAMNYGLERLKTLPLSLRLIREIHRELMGTGRGSEKTPGEFRRSQNWIGSTGSTLNNAAFVPPPPHEMLEALSELERFMHAEIQMPLLVRCALVHSQFETIHPFLDGNGRVGRLLITFLLCHAGALQRPLLYLSYYFKSNRQSYYERLNGVRFAGEWEAWVKFFLRGVVEVARQAATTAKRILEMSKAHHGLVREAWPRSSANALKLLDHLFQQPFVASRSVSQVLGVSAPTANSLLATFEEIGLLKKVSRQSWGRVFAYAPYMHILREGTEQEPRVRKERPDRSQAARSSARRSKPRKRKPKP